ncbi:hypothetical protein IW262DRAFT_999600 [Armillaria fumosa]|nr:hypothetical protein IW262DRAFT_999600 [Armillaria fumosa]
MATSARASPDGRNGPPRDTRTQLFVGNLPYRVRWQDLKDLFRQAGTVLRADVSLGPDNRSRGYGTVLLATAEDAGRAVDKFNGYSWQTRILEVRPDRLPLDFDNSTATSANSYSLPDVDSLSLYGLERPASSASGGRNLFVGNLPFHCQWQDLKDLFRQAGTIIRADVALGPDGRSRGFGTVVFATDYDADRAVKMFNGYEYNGRPLKVHYDKFSPPSGATPASPSASVYGQALSAPPNQATSTYPPSHSSLPTGYLDLSAPSSPYEIYPPQLQMSMPHPHHTHSHIHQPTAQKDPIQPPPALPSSRTTSSSTTSSAGSTRPSLSANPSNSASTRSSNNTPFSEEKSASPPQNPGHTSSSHHAQHPHHPGPISIPPPPPVTSFTMHPGLQHQMSPVLISPLYHPMSPLHHVAIPMTPHGLPPITPSMPPFTFLPPPSFGQPLKTSDSDMSMNGFHHPPSFTSSTMPPTTPPPSSPSLDSSAMPSTTSLSSLYPYSNSDSDLPASPTSKRRPSPSRRPHPLQAPHLTPFSPGLAMSPGAFWGRNPYMNPAPGAPVHPYHNNPYIQSQSSPGYPVPSPGGFQLHPQPSPGGFFYTAHLQEPKGYFDSVMAMGGLTGNNDAGNGGGYFGSGVGGVEDEILKGKVETDVPEVKVEAAKNSAGLAEIDDVFFTAPSSGPGPSRSHSLSASDEKRPTIQRASGSDPTKGP